MVAVLGPRAGEQGSGCCYANRRWCRDGVRLDRDGVEIVVRRRRTAPSHATVADRVPRGVASHLEREVRRGGVVDRDCWVHGAPNVFVAGSAAFPISGFAGPTLTVIALALCVGDRIVGDGR